MEHENEDFEKKLVNDILQIVSFFFSTSLSACGTSFRAILPRWSSLKILLMVRSSIPVSACNSNSIYPILHDA